MKNFRLFGILTVISVLCLSVLASAAGMRVVTVATDATWPPMEMVNAKKNIVGFDIDYINAVAKEAGFKVKIKNTAWDGIFGGLEIKKYDAIISSVAITEQRKKRYDFSNPYIKLGQIIVVRKEAMNVTTLADLKGKKAGAQIGTTGAMEIKRVPGVELKNYDEIGLAFEDMAAGRISAVVCDEPIAANFAMRRSEYNKKFKMVGHSFTQESYGVVVRKGNKDLLGLINKGIKAIKAKKIDEQLVKKWLR